MTFVEVFEIGIILVGVIGLAQGILWAKHRAGGGNKVG